MYQLQQPTSHDIDVNKQYLNLQHYAELAKYVMESPVCEINIIDTYFRDSEVCNEGESFHNNKLYNDTINQSGVYEIEDLSKDTPYKDHPYVIESPHFRYYCGAKLTAANGRDIGSIHVLDTKAKCVSNKQKEQLRYLALLVMNAIEYENRYRDMASKLEALSNSFHKLNHDVRTPISGIAGISNLLIEEKDHEFPDQELTMIKESAETILEMIDEVMENLDIDIHNSEDKKRKINRFANIVDQLKRLFHPPSKAKGVSLAFVNQVDTDLKMSRSFALKLLQITSNLLSNAVKFTPQNGAVEVTITQETVKNKDILHITVKDTGKGMTADQISACKNGDAVTRSAGTNGEQSFGRGLTYVKQMVTQAGGTISVKAGQNYGTQFSISLPLPVDKANTNNLMPSFLDNFPTPKSNGNGIKKGAVDRFN